MHYTKQTISSFITKANILMVNSQKAEDIKDAVDKYGYDEERMAKGEALVKQLKELSEQQELQKSKKVLLFSEKKKLQQKVHKLYMKYLKLARIAFADDLIARRAMLLDGGRERTYNEWLIQVNAFVMTLLESDEHYLKAIGGYGVQKEQLVELQGMLVKLSKLSTECLIIAGELRKTTAAKQRKVIDVQNYISDFVKVARIALEYSPQSLKVLGIGVKS